MPRSARWLWRRSSFVLPAAGVGGEQLGVLGGGEQLEGQVTRVVGSEVGERVGLVRAAGLVGRVEQPDPDQQPGAAADRSLAGGARGCLDLPAKAAHLPASRKPS